MTSGRHRRQGSVHKRIKVTDGLHDILESERRRKERFNDTILRIIMEKGSQSKEISDLKEINDYLKRQIDELKPKPKRQAEIIQN